MSGLMTHFQTKQNATQDYNFISDQQQYFTHTYWWISEDLSSFKDKTFLRHTPYV